MLPIFGLIHSLTSHTGFVGEFDFIVESEVSFTGDSQNH